VLRAFVFVYKKFPYRPTRDVSLLSGHASNEEKFASTVALRCHFFCLV